ncbi:hypothetical protein [Paenibacillus macquariensis]|uniref:Nudix hydrolase domain-containing protein n=1 Tax=Paenibacillus macquariensis TaxID=948756 RepID=A0ABY1K637_9BACL|nr:hypothetical protein [Paenibacillus macquariensis]MEC0090537.1 hypothetical protein [Paenibacillus macquariensis]OAB38536.1 hypothetical protein PMSM_01680 [Paenibacillus macquariensis subsp. macquariensis]SIR30770.1 hypothetical protein SAMN05421578_110158 [Paenibacillus macquariensis]
MNYLGNVWNWLISIPYLGGFLLTVAMIVGLNEIIDKISGHNLLKLLTTYLTKLFYSRTDVERRKYYTELASVEFQSWQMSVLRKIYGEQNIIDLFGVSYASTVYYASENLSYPYKDLGELESPEITENMILRGISKKYYKLMGKTIRRPNLAGFVLESLNLNESGQISGFKAKIATYKLNVATSHVLEYELYLVYKKYKNEFLSCSKDQMIKQLKLRNNIHNDQLEEEVLITGKGRYSLLGVQMLVIFITEDNEYRALVIKRSEDVAVRPGYYQFVPSGGFEFYEKEINEINTQKNFDVELALYREMVEEIFGEVEFEHNDKGNPVDNIYKHEKVVSVRSWLKEGQAKMEFLGTTIDLVSLRHELSFLLLINDKQFSMNNFYRNHEADIMEEIDIRELENHFKLGKEHLNPTSASLLKLALASQTFKEINNTSSVSNTG